MMGFPKEISFRRFSGEPCENFRGVCPTAQVLTKLEANSTDFYRQMASATLPEDLTVQVGKQGGGGGPSVDFWVRDHLPKRY